MSALAILLDACVLAHVQEPADFYRLSDHAQSLWLAHARNKASGAYTRPEPTKEEKKAAMKDRVLEAARARGAIPKKED